MKSNNQYINTFDKQIQNLFKSVLRKNLLNPSKIWFYLRTFLWQKKAISKRNQINTNQVQIPPVLIFSITNKCNLNCKGCYVHAQNRDVNKEISLERINKLFGEAQELGISFIFIVGGEPLTRMDVLEKASHYKRLIFPIFTNGTLLSDKNLALFKKNSNLIPVLSIEGNEDATIIRRGEGIYRNILLVAEKLKKNKIFFGFSITLTKDNADTVLNDNYIEEILLTGCQIIYFVEYVPENQNDIINCITDKQKAKLKTIIKEFRVNHNALFISLPGDEEQYGGCLAAGRGFIHISADGSMEPCPFAPYSDININDLSLLNALKSEFLYRIREKHSELTESKGGCTLWENKEWVEEQLEKTKAKTLN